MLREFFVLILAFACLAIPFLDEPVYFADSPEEAEALAPLEALETPGFDVLHYDLSITFNHPSSEYEGCSGILVAIVAEATANIKFQMGEGLVADSVFVDGESFDYSRYADTIDIELDDVPTPADSHYFEIYYHGMSGRGIYTRRNPEGQYITFSFSEPLDSRHWWPCHDAPYDKATLCTHFTIPEGLDINSNGIAVDTVGGGGYVTFHFEHDHQIPPYLVSVAISDYSILDHEYEDFPITTYFYPEESRSTVIDRWGYVTDVMDVYQDIFAPYPFERYSMSLVPDGGRAMEHQTCTSMGDGYLADERFVVAHELSHHWWGDAVTCGTWKDIWLNEGFAVNSEALYIEQAFDFETYRDYVYNTQLSYLYSTEYNLFPLYDPDFMWGTTVYRKGGSVMDMLRYQLGDETFFDVLHTYYDRYLYQSAVTEDFIEICEEVYGDSIDWFFDQWVFNAMTPEIDIVHFRRFMDDSTTFGFMIHQQDSVYRLKSAIVSHYDVDDYYEESVLITENNQMIEKKMPLIGTVVYDQFARVLCRRNYLSGTIGAEPSDSGLFVLWNTVPEWTNTEEIYQLGKVLHRMPDSFIFINDIADTTFIDDDPYYGIFEYFVLSNWNEDTTMKCVVGDKSYIVKPITGSEHRFPGVQTSRLDSEGDCEVFYLPTFDADSLYGFDIDLQVLRGSATLTVRKGLVPSQDSTWDFMASASEGETASLRYSDITSPAFEPLWIYYIVIEATSDDMMCAITSSEIDISNIEEAARPEKLQMVAYPNPFNSSVSINLPKNTSEVNVYDLYGRKVDKIAPNTNTSIKWTPKSDIESGMYIVEAIDDSHCSETSRVLYIK